MMAMMMVTFEKDCEGIGSCISGYPEKLPTEAPRKAGQKSAV